MSDYGNNEYVDNWWLTLITTLLSLKLIKHHPLEYRAMSQNEVYTRLMKYKEMLWLRTTTI